MTRDERMMSRHNTKVVLADERAERQSRESETPLRRNSHCTRCAAAFTRSIKRPEFVTVVPRQSVNAVYSSPHYLSHSIKCRRRRGNATPEETLKPCALRQPGASLSPRSSAPILPRQVRLMHALMIFTLRAAP